MKRMQNMCTMRVLKIMQVKIEDIHSLTGQSIYVNEIFNREVDVNILDTRLDVRITKLEIQDSRLE